MKQFKMPSKREFQAMYPPGNDAFDCAVRATLDALPDDVAHAADHVEVEATVRIAREGLAADFQKYSLIFRFAHRRWFSLVRICSPIYFIRFCPERKEGIFNLAHCFHILYIFSPICDFQIAIPAAIGYNNSIA